MLPGGFHRPSAGIEHESEFSQEPDIPFKHYEDQYSEFIDVDAQPGEYDKEIGGLPSISSIFSHATGNNEQEQEGNEQIEAIASFAPMTDEAGYGSQVHQEDLCKKIILAVSDKVQSSLLDAERIASVAGETVAGYNGTDVRRDLNSRVDIPSFSHFSSFSTKEGDSVDGFVSSLSMAALGGRVVAIFSSYPLTTSIACIGQNGVVCLINPRRMDRAKISDQSGTNSFFDLLPPLGGHEGKVLITDDIFKMGRFIRAAMDMDHEFEAHIFHPALSSDKGKEEDDGGQKPMDIEVQNVAKPESPGLSTAKSLEKMEITGQKQETTSLGVPLQEEDEDASSGDKRKRPQVPPGSPMKVESEESDEKKSAVAVVVNQPEETKKLEEAKQKRTAAKKATQARATPVVAAAAKPKPAAIPTAAAAAIAIAQQQQEKK